MTSAFLTATTMACDSSSSCFVACLAYGRLICTPSCSIGVTTMKMMSNTRQMSTNGVTLMSELRPPLPPACIASDSRGLTLQEEIDQLRRGVGHLDPEEVDLSREIVEHPDRRDGDAQADRGRDQRLGDTRRDRADPARAGGGHAGEGVDDPDDGAEQPDERGRRPDGGEPAEAA